MDKNGCCYVCVGVLGGGDLTHMSTDRQRERKNCGGVENRDLFHFMCVCLLMNAFSWNMHIFNPFLFIPPSFFPKRNCFGQGCNFFLSPLHRWPCWPTKNRIFSSQKTLEKQSFSCHLPNESVQSEFSQGIFAVSEANCAFNCLLIFNLGVISMRLNQPTDVVPYLFWEIAAESDLSIHRTAKRFLRKANYVRVRHWIDWLGMEKRWASSFPKSIML